jgi:hypothetical protein
MKTFKLSKASDKKVMDLFKAMDKLDDVYDSLKKSFAEDDTISRVRSELHSLVEDLLVYNENLIKEEFSKWVK